jgi:hypothetical protein
MMIIGYGNFTHGADDRGDILLVVCAKRHERDHQLDEVICEPLLVVPTKQMTPFAPSPSGPTRCPFWENDGRMSGCRALEVYH